jgi:hypothetical protein
VVGDATRIRQKLEVRCHKRILKPWSGDGLEEDASDRVWRCLMLRRVFCLAIIASLSIAVGMRGQTPAESDKPVWTMEFLKVKPGKFGMTLGYLDDGWMREREEAKRQGAVLHYSRISEPGTRESEHNIVLLTEYRDYAAYQASDSLFTKIRKELPETTPAILRHTSPEELYAAGATRVFEDYSDAGGARMKLLAEK